MSLAMLVAPLLALTATGAGNEVVLVLDTSCSMIVPSVELGNGKTYPANDPERAAVLGALIVEGLARGSEDKLSVIGFGKNASEAPPIVSTAEAIRNLPYTNGTYFKLPLQEARKRLDSSQLPRRVFLFFTDGAPEDLNTPDEGPKLLGLDKNSTLDTLIVGLYGSPDAQALGEQFLKPMARNPDDLVLVSKPNEIVAAFTKGYARALGSRPETGTLAAGATRTVDVGKYVVEVLVATASSKPGAPFQAKLTGPQGDVKASATGDNSCMPGLRISNAPTVCQAPYRHYEVFRAPNAPETPSKWTLSIPGAPGDVDYGIILRYDLSAAIRAPSPVKVGEEQVVEANLLFRGQIFDDEAFFKTDGFAVTALLAGKPVILTHSGGGKFTGKWTPDSPTADASSVAQVTFRNAWMEVTARQPIVVEGYLDLQLKPTPNPLELGTWRGERKETKRCATLDLTSSPNADRVAVSCTTSGDLPQGTLTCNPVAGSEAKLPEGKGQPLKWEVCATAKGCCSEMAPSASVKLVGTHPHYSSGAVTVPVTLKVEETGFLRCWWMQIAIALGTLFLLFLIAGFTRPHNFDAAATVSVAGSDPGLKRSSAQVLRELPGGRRGFYRNARICLNADGDFVRKPHLAVIVIEATGGGMTRFRKAQGLEHKVMRTGKWEAVAAADLPNGYQPGTLYRSGNLHVKFG